MRTTIAELVAVLAMDSTKFKQGIKGAETSASRMAQNLGAIGKRMTMMVTLPIVAAGVATTKMAMDFESQMANIFTLMDKATIASRDWKKEVLDLSKKVPQSTDVLSKGLYDIVSAGIDAGKAMDVLEVASIAATAGLTDTAVSVDAITSVLNAYGLEAEDASDVSDVLFTTIRYGKTTFAELGPAIGRVAATASAAGVSFDEVGAALATMTISGLKTDEAVVSLNQTILSFLKPTDQAIEAAESIGFELSATTLATEGLGGAMTELSKKVGITVDDMVEMEQAGLTDAEMYDELANKTGKSAEMMVALFPSIRSLKGALILAKDEGAKFNEMLGKQEERLGAAEAAFAKIAETTKFEFDLALSSLKATAIEIGTKLLPLATKLFKSIGNLANKWGELSDASQNAVLVMAGITAAIGPLVWVTSKVWKLVLAVKALNVAAKAWVTTMGLFAAVATAVLAVGQAGDWAASKIDNYYLASLARATLPHATFIRQTKSMIEVIRGLQDGTLTWSEYIRMNGREIDEWAKKHRESIEDTNAATASIRHYEQTLIDTGHSQEEVTELVKKYAEGFGYAVNEQGYLVEATGGVIEATEEEIDVLEEALKLLQEYSDELPNASNRLLFLTQMLQDGKIDIEVFAIEVEKLRVATRGGTTDIKEAEKYTGRWAQTIEDATLTELEATVAHQENETVLKNLMEQYDWTRGEAEKYAEAEGLLESQTEDATVAIDDQTESVDKLRGAFNELIDVLFDEIDVDNRLQEAKWKVADIQKELNKLVDEGKEGTREYEEKINELDGANKELINSLYGVYTNVDKTIEEQEIARQGALEYGAQLVQTGQWGVDAFVELARQFDLSGQEIIDKADEMDVDIKKYFQDAIDSGADNFIALAAQFGISSGEIIGFADTMELEINDAVRERFIEIEKEEERKEMERFSNDLNRDFDFATRMRTLTIDKAPAETAMSEFQKMANAALDGIQDEDVTVTINTVRNETIRRIYDPFSVPEDQGRHGLLVEAQEGLFASAGNARPVLIHPPELILNKEQALNVLWNMATQPKAVSSGMQDTSIVNNYNITTPEALTESEIKRQIDLVSREFGHRMGVGI